MSPVRSIAAVLTLAGLLVTGCTTVRREVIVSAHHPANPDAAEAQLPPDSSTLAIEPAAPPSAPAADAPAHHHTHQRAPADGDPADAGAGGQ